jgi:hypothetical protein
MALYFAVGGILVASQACGSDDSTSPAGGNDGGSSSSSGGGSSSSSSSGGSSSSSGGSSSGSSGGSSSGSSSGGTDAGAAPTWTTVYTTLFGTTCSTCHSPTLASFNGNLDLSSKSTAYNMLVGVTATCEADAGSTFKRVVAGKATQSLLYSKLSATPECGFQMPLGQAPFTTAQLAEVAAWINAGALNN